MSAVVFIDVVEPGPDAEQAVAALKRNVPATFAIVAGTDRIEVFFSGPDVDEDGARQALEEAIAAADGGGFALVQVVYPKA